jgi:hypothetical protein
MQVNVHTARGSKAGLVFGTIFCLIFCAFGLFAVLIGVGEVRRGQTGTGAAVAAFGLVFAGIGAGVFSLIVRGHKTGAAEQQKRAKLADTPWLWRDDWAAGRIVYSAKSSMWLVWGFALFWNAISWPVVFALPRELAKGNDVIWIGLIFPVAGIGMLVWAIRSTIQWTKFGESVFEMASVPGVIGGTLTGVLRPGSGLRLMQEYSLRLSVVHRVVTGSGKHRSTRESVLWTEEKKIHSDLNGGVPVSFLLPGDSRETDIRNSDNAVIWRLEASAEVPGVDYSATFEMPVFRLAQTPEQAAQAEAARAQQQSALAGYQPSRDSRVYVRPALQGGMEFIFSACRNPAAALLTTAFTLVWTAVLFVLILSKAPLIFPIVWGLFDVILLYAVFEQWFASTRVVIRPGRIEVERGPLSFSAPKVVSAENVLEIKAAIGMTAGTRTYSDIHVLCRDGGKVTAGGGIRDKQHADWLAAEMNRAFSAIPR